MVNSPLTIALIAITCITSYMAWNNRDMYFKWIGNPYMMVHRKQYHRLISAGFLHADLGHLAFNMITLYFFGPLTEAFFAARFGDITGGVVYIGFYLLAMVVSSLPSLVKYKDYPHYNALGASGAVSAVLFFFVLFAPLENLYLYFAIPIPAIIFGVLYIAFSYYMAKRNADNIGHDAHLFGALFGFFAPIAIEPRLALSFIDQLLSAL